MDGDDIRMVELRCCLSLAKKTSSLIGIADLSPESVFRAMKRFSRVSRAL
jgi:hypothetical protein